MIERQAMDVVEYPCGALRIGHDPQRFQLGDELIRLRRSESAPVLLAREHGARLIKPQHRHQRVLTGRQPVQDAVGIGMRRVLETPSHGDGVIEDKGHARP